MSLLIIVYRTRLTTLHWLEDWASAQIDFFESFKNYDEAGSPQRIQVLKYLVLAHMLMDSTINPFDSQETKPSVPHLSFLVFLLLNALATPPDSYKVHPEIVAMTNLVSAYQRRDVHEAEKILRGGIITYFHRSLHFALTCVVVGSQS